MLEWEHLATFLGELAECIRDVQCGYTYEEAGKSVFVGERREAAAAHGEYFQARPVPGPEDRLTRRLVSRHFGVEERLQWNKPRTVLGVNVIARPLEPGSGPREGAGPRRDIHMPRVLFTDGMANPLEHPADEYSDGVELAPGEELPPWRVFFREGRDDGLILFAPSRAAMSRVQVIDDGFQHVPNRWVCYNTGQIAPWSSRPEQHDFARPARLSFAVALWRRDSHEDLLTELALAARAGQPAKRPPRPRPAGTPVPRAAGPGETVLTELSRNAPPASRGANPLTSWRVVQGLRWTRSRSVLFAGPGVAPPPIRLTPGLSGTYRLIAGIGNGDGIRFRLSGDPHWRFAVSVDSRRRSPAGPFQNRLVERAKGREMKLGDFEMEGRELEIGHLPGSYHATMVDYLRFAPARRAGPARERKNAITVAGFNDIPDIATLMDLRAPDPATFAANLWAHAEARVRRVYWRVDGQCSDYPSKVNTMRYPCARVHDVFTPQSKAYGRALLAGDALRIAVDESRRHGLELYGWMRMNNYSLNVVSDFYVKHPSLREESERGAELPKLCFAFDEVREHKRSILLEAARYGLSGLCLGVLRHPPMVNYAPVVVRGYRETYGVDPPRNRATKDWNLRNGPEPRDEESRRWLTFRAGYFTRFVRELRDDLARARMESIRIAVWIRPYHALFDGVDLESWLREGLVDEIVTQQYSARPELDEPGEDFVRMVGGRAELVYGISGFEDPTERRLMGRVERALDIGFDSVCVYESDYTVHDPDWQRLHARLARLERRTAGRAAVREAAAT